MNIAAPHNGQALTPWGTLSMTINRQFDNAHAIIRDQANCNALAADACSLADANAIR